MKIIWIWQILMNFNLTKTLIEIKFEFSILKDSKRVKKYGNNLIGKFSINIKNILINKICFDQKVNIYDNRNKIIGNLNVVIFEF